MSNELSKEPQIDAAEDDAFFPSAYSLDQFTSEVSDLKDAEYDPIYKGNHKILVIAADERYLETDNGTFFSTGNHPIETLIPMYHLNKAGFSFDIATISGQMVKFEHWAMPKKDTRIIPFFKKMSNMVEKWSTIMV